MSGAPGGLTGTRPATPEVQKFCDVVEAQAEKMTGKDFRVFRAIAYRSQVVAGTNYFIKVHVGDDDYVHMRVFEPLPYEHKPAKLDNIETGKHKDDPINYIPAKERT